MKEREMLEFAAKAAGYKITNDYGKPAIEIDGKFRWLSGWIPLSDDADAFRLAVSLALLVDALHERAMPSARYALGHRDWTYGDNVRDAIVKCAAEIGKAMP